MASPNCKRFLGYDADCKAIFLTLLPEKLVLLMISRRQLRIKALSVLYACNRKEIDDLADSRTGADAEHQEEL